MQHRAARWDRRWLLRRALGAVAAGGAFVAGACTPGTARDVTPLPAYAYRSHLVQIGYRFALEQPDLLAQLPCYCGCSQLKPAHTSLRDCFLKPEGGFEEHASGCTVCVDEARDSRQMFEQGQTVA